MDITQRKQAEEALIRNEKLAATGRLAVTIAHEINNPLEAMVNILYLLGQSVKEAHARAYVALLDRQAQTISRIATQTLKFHRDKGRAAEFELAELVQDLLEFPEIDPKHRSRPFEPFFTTNGEQGTGLGLWVSLGIVQRAGGSMRVRSTQRPGRSGTCRRRESQPTGSWGRRLSINAIWRDLADKMAG